MPAGFLFVGVLVSAAHPLWTRPAAVTVQSLAVLSALMTGIILMTEVGSATFPHWLYHLVLILMLLRGLTAVKEGPSKPVLLQLHWRG